MKKFLRIASLLLVCILFGFAALACANDDIEKGDDENRNENNNPSITTDSSISIHEFEFGEIAVTLKNLEGTVVWTSSDTGIVTVDESGKVYGVKAGIAEVSASVGELKSVCSVAVLPTEYEHKIVLSQETISMFVKESVTVNVSVLFNDNPLDKSFISEIQYNPSDKYSLSLNENKDLVIYASKAYDGVIEVTAEIRGYTVRKYINLTIKDENQLLEPDEDELPWIKANEDNENA